MPCPCPPPKTSHNCPCNSLQFSLRIDDNQNVEPNPTSNYDLIDMQISKNGKEFHFSPIWLLNCLIPRLFNTCSEIFISLELY